MSEKCLWKELLEESLKKYSTATSGVLKKSFYPWNDRCVYCDGARPECRGYLTTKMFRDERRLADEE